MEEPITKTPILNAKVNGTVLSLNICKITQGQKWGYSWCLESVERNKAWGDFLWLTSENTPDEGFAMIWLQCMETYVKLVKEDPTLASNQ